MTRVFMFRDRVIGGQKSPGLYATTRELIDHFRDQGITGDADLINLLDVLRTIDARIVALEKRRWWQWWK